VNFVSQLFAESTEMQHTHKAAAAAAAAAQQ
jgi:hypothetical protein